MKIWLTLLSVATLFAPGAVRALPLQTEPENNAAVCQGLRDELAVLIERRRGLQAQLGGAVEGVDQSGRNTQVTAQRAQALGWATAAVSLMPGVGYAASAAGAAATHQAIEGQQREIAASTQNLQGVVQQLVPVSQRLHTLEMDLLARGCP